MPFADYKNFQDCLQKNKGKDDPEAYCAEIKRKTEKLVDWNYHLSFTKIAEIDDVMYIAGEASNPDEDEDGELMDMESLKGAFNNYMANPVVKFMHDKAPQWRGAIGVVVQKYTDSGGKVWETRFGSRPFLVAKFVKGTMPGWMWKGIQEGNYKGFSIGGKALKKVAGRIYVKSWLETSVVDIPSAHGAFFTVLKVACTGKDCALEKIKTPIDSEKNPETAVEPYKETDEDKKRSSWYNMSEIIRFKKDFPQASPKDIQERFGWEEKYIKELLEKIDSVSDKYTQKNSQVSSFVKTINDYILDSFLKGGVGSGRKGHRTEKKEEKKTLKQPYEMELRDFALSKGYLKFDEHGDAEHNTEKSIVEIEKEHLETIYKAQKEGKKIPSNVLKSYPTIFKKTAEKEEKKGKERTELWNRVMGAAAQKKEMDSGIIRRGRITDRNKGD